jgi:hypothetical protein
MGYLFSVLIHWNKEKNRLFNQSAIQYKINEKRREEYKAQQYKSSTQSESSIENSAT